MTTLTTTDSTQPETITKEKNTENDENIENTQKNKEQKQPTAPSQENNKRVIFLG